MDVRAEEHQAAHPLGMAGRVGDGDGAALRNTKQREAVQPEVVDHGLQVLQPRAERQVGDVVVGQAASPLVVAHQHVLAGQPDEPVAPHRALPVVVEMGDPVGGPHQWRARADGGVGEPGAVGSGAEADLLTELGGNRKLHPFRRIAQLIDRGDEPVAATMDGLHDALVAPAVTECLPCLLDPGRQRRLRHELMAPDCVQELGLGDHAVPVFDEMGEHVEHLRLDVHELTTARQLESGRVEHAVVEAVPHRQIVTGR